MSKKTASTKLPTDHLGRPRMRARPGTHRIGFWVASLFVLVVSPAASGQLPEPLPHYSESRLLGEDSSLHAVAFGNESLGLAVGDRGTILRTFDRGTTWHLQPSGVTCRLQAVHWIDDQRVVVIGGGYDRITRISRGVVLWSSDGGRRWQRAADQELPRLRSFARSSEADVILAVGDFSHVALSREFESSDGGRTWQGTGEGSIRPSSSHRLPSSKERRAWTEATGTPIAIRDACRVGKSDLWAVGDHGVILHSADTGRSWRTVRGQGRRLAVLVVSASKSSVAWPLVANESIEMRNRVAVLIDDPKLNQIDLDLLGQVTAMLGGAGADGMASESSIVESATDWIAIHQPLVLVLDQDLPEVTRSALTDAAIAAGVLRIASYSFNSRGDTMLHRGALLPRRGVLVGDLWEDALQLVAPNQSLPNSLAIRRIYDSVGAPLQGDSVTSGLPIAAGCKLTASIEPAPRRQLQIVQARMSQPKQIAELIRTSRTAADFSKTLGSMLDQTSKDDQFRLAWSVLQSVMRASQLPASDAVGQQQSVLEEIAQRFDDTSAGKWAGLRRDAMQHSLEWRHLRSTVADVLAAHRPTVDAIQVVPVSPFQIPPSGVRQVSAVAPLVVPEPEAIGVRTKTNKPSQVDLPWEFHPLVLIAREAARNRGDDDQLQLADNGSANLNRLTSTFDIGPGTVLEPWARLLRSDSPSVVVARRAESPPRLDGKFDDACWTSALSQAGQTVAIRIAYDDQFLYVAIRTRADRFHADTISVDQRQKPRDHDLSNVDRLRLCIDTDQDLLTSMQLQISDAGRTHDAIDGYDAWQPTWYVDSHRGEQFVDVEMAILRRDVIELPIHAGQSWFVSAELLPAGIVTPWQAMPDAGDWLRVVFR